MANLVLDNSFPFYCYILLCSTGDYYCGITNNLERRLEEHNTKTSGWAAMRKPVMYVAFNGYQTRKEARKEEKRVKNFGVKQYYNRIRFDPSTNWKYFIKKKPMIILT